MKQAHWSNVYLTFVMIEVTYSDGSRQGWDYDCSRFATLEDMKLNMTADFKTPREDGEMMQLFVTRNEEHYSAELPITDLTGADFVDYIFNAIDEMLTWQPAEIS